MTIGISKEDLLQFLKEHDFDDPLKTDKALTALLKELNPWLPIDENTPKDRLLVMRTKEYGDPLVGKWFACSDRGWWAANCIKVTPTHYQELPEDIK